MEEETTQKTIALVMDGAKLSARELRSMMKMYLDHQYRQKSGKSQHKTVHKKISVKELIGQDAGAKTIEISDSNIKSFGVSQYLCWYCIITSPVGSCAHPLHCANSKFAQCNSRLQTVCPSCRLRNERRWKIMHYSD